MAAADPAPAADPGGLIRRLAAGLLGGITALALLLVVHSYALPLLPDRAVIVPPDAMHHDPEGRGFAFFVELSVPGLDRPQNPRSRVGFRENGRVYPDRSISLDPIRNVGGWRYSHQPDRIYFSSRENSDPRTNGRIYEVLVPRLYSPALGRWSLAVFSLGALVLAWLAPRARPPAAAPAPSPGRVPRLPVALAAGVFLAGLYANTGTLAPYGNTFHPHVESATGYLYNTDHVHFRQLFAFVDGQPRAAWDGCLFLRRILFNVLAWPFTKAWGYETGGVIASLVLQLGAFFAAVTWTARRHGARTAVVLAWLMALYPGSAYWAGQPYPYAFIVPGSLLLLAGLHELAARRSWAATLGLSAALGLAYLGYDLAPFFLPASLLLLAGQRRWLHGAASLAVQVAPLALWLLVLKYGLGQNLENSNSGIYRAVAGAYLDLGAWRHWAEVNRDAVDVAAETFFGANFLFWPALFLAALALNPWTARLRFTAAELALGASVVALFAFNNLAPVYGGWPMRGAWISRLYQPGVVVLLFFTARWLAGWPEFARGPRRLAAAAALAAALGNGFVLAGPASGDPGRVAETAHYRFYNHVDDGAARPFRANLEAHGRRPLGFPKPAAP